ncbi:MAG: phasin family protein [Gammaproteobacteria bacterium]|nr:phasin family protein [Gammaproteobacteria bacterium]
MKDALSSLEKLATVNASLLEKLIASQSTMLKDCQAIGSESLKTMRSLKNFPEFLAAQHTILLQCSEKAVENYKTILSVVGDSRDDYFSMADESLKSVGSIGDKPEKKSPAPKVAAKTAGRKTARKAA